jgi:ferredoxin-NADP reductase
MDSNRISFLVKSKLQVTPSITKIVLEPQDPDFTYQAGQFLTFLFDHLAEKEVRRSYSLCTAPSVDPLPAISVRKIPNGLVSRYLCDVLTEGTELHSLPPAGQFTLPEHARDIFLIGGGSGVGPLFGLLKEALLTRPELRITFLNANTRHQDILFGKDLFYLAREYYDRMTLLHFVSEGVTEAQEDATNGVPIEWIHGRLGNARLEMLVRQYQTGPPELAHFYVCGPEGLMLKTENTLYFMGYARTQVHHEQFIVAPPFRPSAEIYSDARVAISYRGQILEFPVAAGQTILEAAERAGVSLPFSCRSGSCTTCQAQCTEGLVDMYMDAGRMDSQMTMGQVFTCVGYPLSDRVKLEIR